MSAKTPEEMVAAGASLAAAMNTLGMAPGAALVLELTAAVAAANKLPMHSGHGATLFDARSGESFVVGYRENVAHRCSRYPYEAFATVGDREVSGVGQNRRDAVRALLVEAQRSTDRSLRLYYESEDPWARW